MDGSRTLTELEVNERVQSAVASEVSLCRRKLHQKMKLKVAKMQSRYELERSKILDMVQAECAVILSEAKEMLARRLRGADDTDSSTNEARAEKETKWYPEMISPEQTLE